MSIVSVVIPARLGSSRLPRKVLLDIAGKPMLQHVWERAKRMKHADELIVATDSEEVQSTAQSWGADVIMTSPDCPSGSARIASILEQLKGDFILNVQGDEPFIPSSLLDGLVQSWRDHGDDIITATYAITEIEEIENPNRVKAVCTHDGRALYFSRSRIPFLREKSIPNWSSLGMYWAHIGVYGYSRAVLEAYDSLPPSPLEEAEKLEQLRFLQAGMSIRCFETNYHPVGVDTQQDLVRANELAKT